MKKNERVIPKKNYFLLLLMMVLVVVITFVIFDINKKYQSRKLEISYLSNYVNEVSMADLNNILTEPSSELFIVVTKTNDEKVYNLEKDIKKVISKYDLRDNVIYIDYTDRENEINELNKILKSEIKTIPALIYFKDGDYVKTVDSSETFLNSGEFQKILDEYEVN